MNYPVKAICLFAIGLFLTTMSNAATKLTVSNYGTDSLTCGSADSPCRSISQAIQNAGSGDTIIVGPGRYGSLNNDGAFTNPGDEHPSNTGGMVDVSKAVTIVSRDGADVTLIDAGTNLLSCVTIEASGAVFGAKAKGFTLLQGSEGVLILAGASHVTVEGNRAVGNGSIGFETTSGSSSNQFIGNVACACQNDGFSVVGFGHLLQGNVAVGNTAHGFHDFGQDILFIQNVASGNHGEGLDTFNGGDTATAIVGSSFIGNVEYGVDVDGPFTLTENNIYGNNTDGLFCNVLSFMSIKAPKNFFGLTIDPDVLTCATNVNFIPFATKEIKVKVIEP
jgi:hypothetical protein